MTVTFPPAHMLAVPYQRRRALDPPVSVGLRTASDRRNPRALKPLNFMPTVAVKRRTPAPIPRRAERQNPHSGNTVALRGFVQDGFCNACPLRVHAAIGLAVSHHRNLNIAPGPR